MDKKYNIEFFNMHNELGCHNCIYANKKYLNIAHCCTYGDDKIQAIDEDGSCNLRVIKGNKPVPLPEIEEEYEDTFRLELGSDDWRVT